MPLAWQINPDHGLWVLWCAMTTHKNGCIVICILINYICELKGIQMTIPIKIIQKWQSIAMIKLVTLPKMFLPIKIKFTHLISKNKIAIMLLAKCRFNVIHKVRWVCTIQTNLTKDFLDFLEYASKVKSKTT